MVLSWKLFGQKLASTVGKRASFSEEGQSEAVRINYLFSRVDWICCIQTADKPSEIFFSLSAKLLTPTVSKARSQYPRDLLGS